MGKTSRTATCWWLVVCVAFFYSDVTAFLERERLIRRQFQSSSVHGYPRSHGTCDTLILSSRKFNTTREIIDRFTRIHGVGKSALYRAYNDNGTISMELFYLGSLRSWVMGTLGKTIQISIHLESDTRNPQESTDGIHILKNSSIQSGLQWRLRPDIYFQCVTDRSHPRSKRAIWLIILGIASLVSTVTTTVLRGVSVQRGCLYYPSVCEMTKEINTILRPRIEKLRSKLQRQLDKIGWKNLSTQLERTKRYFIYLAYSSEKLKNMTDISYNFQLSETHTDTDTLLAGYRDWIRDNSVMARVLGSVSETVSLYVVLLAKTITHTKAILHGAGFLAGIGLSVYDLYLQINEEKQIRDDLKLQKTRLINVFNEMEKNMKQIVDFKSKYIKQVVKPLQLLLGYFPNQFPSFRVYLENLNNPAYIKITYTRHMNTHLANFTKYLHKNFNETRRIIKEREMYTQILNEIQKSLDNKQPPSRILAIIQNYNNSHLYFHSNFDLLRFIAINLTSVSSCYWGIRMDLFRRGQVDKANYSSFPLCRSPELEDYDKEILTNINKTMAPCRILRRLNDDVFDSMYKLIKYIADFILPHRDCYWGYDLAYIRSTSRPSLVFESMKLDAYTFTYLSYLMERTKISKEVISSGLCQDFSVCEGRWQKFIYCSVYPISGSGIDMCTEEKASDCRDMASAYEKDVYCYQ